MPAIPLLALLAALMPTQAAPLTEDLQILEPWRQALRDAQSTDTVVHSAVLGDSVTMTRNTWTYWLRNHLWDHFGNAGEGSVDVHDYMNGDTTGGYVMSPVFTRQWGESTAWTRHLNQIIPEHVWFPTGTWVTCEHAGGGWRMIFQAASVRLRYIAEAGAGSVTVRIGGDIVQTIDADNGGDPTSLTVDVPLPAFGTHTMELENTAPPQAPASVKIDLVDLRSGLPGSVLHRWGQSGKPCSHFLAKSQQMYEHLLGEVEPSVFWIQCDPGDETLDQYDLDLRALVARLQGIRPGMPIVLLSHHRFSNGHVAPTYVMYEVARDDPNVAFINLFDLHDEKADIVTLDYLADTVHLNAKGGQFYAAWIAREMLGWSRADLDVDGAVGQTDLGLLLSAYNSVIGDAAFIDIADLNRDGAVDQPDLGLLLADYGWTAP